MLKTNPTSKGNQKKNPTGSKFTFFIIILMFIFIDNCWYYKKITLKIKSLHIDKP